MGAASEKYDLIIVGAGPAGTAAALYAARAGLSTLLLDEESFPRDKICGDALSGKSVDVLKELQLLDKVRDLPGAAINRIIFSSPKGTELVIHLGQSNLETIPEGFVIRRRYFDEFMFQQAGAVADRVITGFKVNGLLEEDGHVTGVRGVHSDDGNETNFSGSIVIGADGCHSVVARNAGLLSREPRHTIGALRQYYEGVAGLTDQIELHFVDEIIPGYFWIFPIENGHANIGLGMPHSAIKSQGISLKNALTEIISRPPFKERFANARPLEGLMGWNLPVGSLHRRNYGAGFMLLGDAAGLIDPFTGEGIGNALYSARYAVKTAKAALATGDVGAQALARYDQELWSVIGGELDVSSKMQKIGQYRPLLNFVINKAARSYKLRNLIGGMIANEVPKAKLTNPLFYLRLLFS